MKESPLSGIKLPREQKKLAPFLAVEHVQTILRAIDADIELKKAEGQLQDGELVWLKDVIHVAVCTGLRRGELCSLRWSQIDFEAGFLYVKNREARGSDSGFQTKSAAERPVPLVGDALAALRRLDAQHEDPAEDDFIFKGINGRQLNAEMASKRFKRYVRLCRLSEEINFHSLRHTCASWLVMRGVPLRIVQEILGHSSVQVTQRYAHLAPDTMKTAMQQAFEGM